MSDERATGRAEPTTRRRVLRFGALGAGVALAGCSGTDGGSPTDDETGAEAGDGTGTGTGPGTTPTPGSGGFTPWQWRRADPGQTYATPDPAPESLELVDTYELKSGPGGSGAAPAVTDAGVFSLSSDIVRVDPASEEVTYSRSAPGNGKGEFVQGGILVVRDSINERVIGLRADDAERAWLVDSGSVTVFPTGDGVGYVGIERVGVLESESGETRWEKTSGESDPAFATTFKRPRAVHPESGTMFGARFDQFENGLVAVEAYDVATGERRWRREDEPSFPFAAHGDTLLASGGGAAVVALDRTSGDELWRALEEKFPSIARYAVDDDGVYVWTGGDNADVVALDPANGSERWRRPFTGRLSGTAATRDAVVHATTKKLRLLSKEDGSELRMTRFDDSGTGVHRLAAAGGRLYVLMGIYGSAFHVYGSG